MIERLLSALNDELRALASEAGEDIFGGALEDGSAFVRRFSDDVERWISMAASGELTQDELEFLIQAKLQVAQMETLKQKGLAAARLDQLRRDLTRAVAGSVFRIARP
ncbi:MAG: hypothetical protein ACNA78_02430 [Balneolaceae bacterium]